MNNTHDRTAMLDRITCRFCAWRGATLNDRSTHQLAAHERPLPDGRRAPWTVPPRLQPFVPPNWRAASIADWYGTQKTSP